MKDKKSAKKGINQSVKNGLVERLENTAWTFVKTVVDTAPNPFLILDSKSRVIAANKFFYRTFKVSPRETENKLVYNLGRGQWNIPKLKILLEKILPEETYFRNFEVEHSFPKIGGRIMLLNGRQIYEKIGISKTIPTPIILLVIEDITDLRRSQTKAILAKRAIKEVRVELEQQKEINQTKTDFVSLASHQLRTPLSVIKWYTEMLLDGDAGEINAKQKKFLKEIYHSGSRMVELVNAMLNVSRLEMGTFAIELKSTNIPDIAESVIKELMIMAKSKGLRLKRKYDPKCPILSVDPKLLCIILQNLLSNAVKYTARGGLVALEIKLQKSDLLIKVTDTGSGIPKHAIPNIFTRFFRADNAREMDPEGTGLGLYIVKTIVDHAGCKIWFKSEEKRGTIFYLTIPLTGMREKEGTKALI